MEVKNKWNVYAMALTHFLAWLFPIAWTVDTNCDFRQNLDLGKSYPIYSRNYPNNYPGGITCRWLAIAESNAKITIQCTDVNIPASSNCYQDRLVVSTTGSIHLEDAHTYCGKGTFTLTSDANQLSIGFQSAQATTGGRFYCTLSSERVSGPLTPPPPPPSGDCECGWRNSRRIVGGAETLVNEYPMMAGLVDVSKKIVACGATIISDFYAVTAAHCLVVYQPPDVGLLVGDHDTTTGADTSAAQLYAIQRFQTHPDYNPKTYVNDIGLVKTTFQIQFNLRVGPVCLPFRYQRANLVNQVVSVLGWGTLSFGGQKSNTLQKADLNVISNQQCKSSFPNIINQQMCTYAPGKDACQADSGGPVLWQSNPYGRVQLVGVISYGIACATTAPGINTRMTSYLSWIVGVTPDATYCMKD